MQKLFIRIRRGYLHLLVYGSSVLLAGCLGRSTDAPPGRDWPVAGNTGNTHYSELDQVNTDNVSRLKIAWTFHSGDLDSGQKGEIQCNPIVVDGLLYGTTPRLKLFALDAATGEQRWSFNPLAAGDPVHVNRGVCYWRKGNDQRILYTAGSKLYAINAVTGKPVTDFGNNGVVNLREGLDTEVGEKYVVATSPGVVYGDIFILGSRVSENNDAAPGHIRAYDIHTGKRLWIFHTIPHPGEYGFDTWPPDAWKTAGGVNAWSGLTLDAKRGIVYVPLGSPSFDFYGGNRKGSNLFGNSLVALEAATGKRVWHFQTVHHDLWDRDLPAAPTLVTVKRRGVEIDAVAQISKQGFVFIFDRETGEPLFPIEERKVPPSELQGEESWPTQPYPLAPEPFVRQVLREEDLSNISDTVHADLLQRFRKYRSGNLFHPPSLEGTVILPGFDGGGEWGGASFDPELNWLFVNASEMPWVLTMVETGGGGSALSAGEQVYQVNCATCHGIDRSGEQHLFPSLLNLRSRLSAGAVDSVIAEGRGRMPSFKHLSVADKRALHSFLMDSTGTHTRKQASGQQVMTASRTAPGSPYVHTGYHRFLGTDKHPAIQPPWGILAAIDLNAGKIEWKSVLGEIDSLSRKGIPPTGTENYGGAVVTRGGLLFIGATKDERFRAFDKKTGRLLWETRLPAGAYATPCTYLVNGKQYIVVAAGGGKMGTRSSDTYIAYSLPE